MYTINKLNTKGGSLPLSTPDGSLRIVFIGVGAAFAKRNRQSNILIIQGDHHILVDCGTQGPLGLDDLGLSVLDMKCCLPTHSHADHIGGYEEIMLMNRYMQGTKPDLIILSDFQDLLWRKSLSGGAEYSEVNEGQCLQITDFFKIRRPKTIEFQGRKSWVYQHGPIEVIIMRSRHFPSNATSVDESQWCSGVLINRKIWISGDTMFDYEYPERYHKESEVMFHDCQLTTGGIHASYEELMSLPKEIRAKMILYHYGDDWDKKEKWVKDSDNFSGNPVNDGFLGWAQQQVAYDFY